MMVSISATTSLCPGKEVTPVHLILQICEIWIITSFLNNCFESCQCATYYIIISFYSMMLFIITWND